MCTRWILAITACLRPSQNTVEFIKGENGTKLIFTEQGVYFDGPEAAQGREQGTRDILDKLGEELDRNG